MVRMQVQLPEELHRKLRAIAESKEWSLAETLRRAGEVFASIYPHPQPANEKWTLPVLDMGELLVPEEKWAELLEEDREGRHLK